MAITVYTKEDTTFLWGEQATFGTILPATVDFNGTTPEWGEILDCENIIIDWGINVREPDRSHTGSRVPLSANVQHDEKGSSPKFTITGDAKKKTLASLLYAVIQNVSEAVGSPYEKTYTFSSTQPDFTANGGWFGTLYLKQLANKDIGVRDVICNELTLTCSPDEGQGRMQMVAQCQGRGPMVVGETVTTGTLARYSQDFFTFHDIKVCTVNGNAIVPLRWECNIKNMAVPIGTNNNAAFLTYALPRYEVTMKLNAVWNSNSHEVQSFAPAVSVLPIVISWGTDDQDGYFSWTMYGTTTPSPEIYDPVKGIELNFRMLNNGSNTPLTVVLADAIDRAW